MDWTSSPDPHDPAADTGGDSSQAPTASARLEPVPKEVGILLLTTGMIIGMLPPPPGPFDISVMLAGGVALWPRGLQAVDGWTRRHFPRAHRAGMSFLDQFLDDLESRYPGSTNGGGA